jgi:tRNA nucleotidyltransferase (CCA-adding enzyme)
MLQNENKPGFEFLNLAYLQSTSAAVLSPQTWPFRLGMLPSTAYLVGGNVRDALLGRSADYLDLDFVMPENAVATARTIARHYHAGFVVLDAEREIARVVFPNATVDFALQVGPTLEADLARRDFTVNAIAYHPQTEELLDPLEGYTDLRQGIIRMISPENLQDDPLRLLRAYRQAAQLGFFLDPETQHTIRQLSGLLTQVAPERVQSELNYLLSTPAGTPLLQMAWNDGLLAPWLPAITQARLQTLQQIDVGVDMLSQRWPEFGSELSGWLREHPNASGTRPNWVKAAKLACLVADDPETAEAQLWRLKYSRVEVQAVVSVLQGLPILIQNLPDLAISSQYDIFKVTGAAFRALVLVSMAQGVDLEAIAPLIEHFLNPHDPVAHPTPLVTGRELMAALHLRPGPQVGELLEMLQRARAEGKFTSAEGAIAYAKDYLKSHA